MVLPETRRRARQVRRAMRQGATQEDVERLLDGDYIPGGFQVSHDDLINFRRAETPFGRCCVSTGNDVQSGPIYCGNSPKYMCDVKDRPEAIVLFCPGHVPDRFYKEKRALVQAEWDLLNACWCD